MKQTWLLLGSVLVLLMIGTASWAYDVSGTIYDSSTSQALANGGRAYLMIADDNGNSTGYGTSLTKNDPGYPNYTIKGLPNGTYQLQGFIDTRGNGIPYAGSPLGGLVSGSNFKVSDSDLTGIDVGFMDQPDDPTYPTASDGVKAIPGNNSAIIFWDTPKNNDGIEIADSYNIYWGTDPNVGPGNTPNGGSVTVASGSDGGHYLLPSLANGSTYYFGVAAVFNGTASTVTTSGALTIGPLTGNNTVSGTIYASDINGNPVTTDKAMFVALSQGDMPLYMAYLPAQPGSPVSSRTFSITGVPAGQYELFAFVDQNGDNQKGTGDWLSPEFDNLRQWIDVQGDLPGQSIIVLKQNAQELLTTRYGNNGSGPGYNIEFNFKQAEKRPAKIDINAGTNFPASSITLNNDGDFNISAPVLTTPTIGYKYSGTITYTDNTTENFSLQISNVIPVQPVQTFPTQFTIPASTKPIFSWNLPSLPAGSYRYNVTLADPNGGNWLMNTWLSADTLSTPIDPSVRALDQSRTYNWRVAVVDSFGNSAESWYNFTPQGSGPTITNVSPLTLACGSGSPITITGTGFSTNPSENHVYFNNLGAATITSASDTELVVQLPSCNSSSVSAGPVIVSDINGVSAASADTFVPTISYSHNVFDSTGNPVTGAIVQLAAQPAITATTDTNGKFTLTGVPAGIPFTLKITPPFSGPAVYSHRLLQFANTSKDGGYTMHSLTDFNELGLETGKGLIASVASDKTLIPISGVAIVAVSSRYQSATHYAVAYEDASGAKCLPNPSTGACTTTGPDGKYYVLNVDEGDTVVVYGFKDSYIFQPRTFETHAGAVSEASLTGTPVPSITGISPTSAVVGGTVTITGTNFSTNPKDNYVMFTGYWPGIVTSATSTTLVVTVPQNTQPGPITVNVNGQTAVSADSFSVPAPTITGFSPTQAPGGTQVTITGTGFSLDPLYDNQVTFNDTFANIISSDGTHLVVEVPYGASTGKIMVHTTGGQITSSNDFTFLPDPSINSASPLSGPIGTQVTISGTFYDFNTANYLVQVQGITATINSVNATSLVFTIPNGVVGPSVTFDVSYNNQSRYSGTFTLTANLALTLAGSGTVNDTNGSGFTCSGSSCSWDFNVGTSIILSATPSAGYLFQAWSGACTGTGTCSLTMDSSKTLTATFSLVPYIKISDLYYPQLQDAFDAAVNGDTIQTQSKVFTDTDLIFSEAAAIVKLAGGYSDGTFATVSGFTTLDGKMSLRNGTLKVSGFKIK